MGSLELLISFTVATAIFAYVPGPAIMYTMAQTMALGRRGGLMAALGLHIGGYAHVLAAAFGLSALFHYVPELFLAVKIAGAFYLIWLGVSMIRNSKVGKVEAIEPKSAKQAMVESITVELLNPKTALFFLAFVPQFVDPSAAYPVWVQFLILGVIVNLAFSSADLVVIWFTAAIVGRLKRSGKLAHVLRMLGGTVLVGLGARLAFERM
jgi:threonine/homoserine/homoserine lactone efflux protein